MLAKYASIGPVNTSKSCSGRLSLILKMKESIKIIFYQVFVKILLEIVQAKSDSDLLVLEQYILEH